MCWKKQISPYMTKYYCSVCHLNFYGNRFDNIPHIQHIINNDVHCFENKKIKHKCKKCTYTGKCRICKIKHCLCPV